MVQHADIDHTGVTGVTGNVAADAIWDAKGDLAVGTGANTAAKLTVGANDTIPMADSAETTGIKWVASATPSTQALGDAAAVGTGDTFTRGDHKHAMPSAGDVLPWHVSIVPMIWTPDAATGTWDKIQFNDTANSFFVQATASVGAIGFYNSTAAQNDAFSYNIVLAAGTWDAHFYARKGSNTAIITLNMDAASQGTVDTYAAAAAHAKLTISGFTVATSGKKVMQFKAATKNASSSGYLIELFGIEFQRTA